MEERKGAVTLRGNAFTLVGKEVKVGDKAPDVELLDNDLKPVKFSAFKGKVVIVSSVPSLDTPTCDMETRRFNTEAEIDFVIERVVQAVTKLREMSPLYEMAKEGIDLKSVEWTRD